jgi:hypothetical protein
MVSAPAGLLHLSLAGTRLPCRVSQKRYSLKVIAHLLACLVAKGGGEQILAGDDGEGKQKAEPTIDN